MNASAQKGPARAGATDGAKVVLKSGQPRGGNRGYNISSDYGTFKAQMIVRALMRSRYSIAFGDEDSDFPVPLPDFHIVAVNPGLRRLDCCRVVDCFDHLRRVEVTVWADEKRAIFRHDATPF